MKSGNCPLCYAAGTLTRDHIIPRLFGGGGGDNIRQICRDCNSQRNHRIGADEWELMTETQKALFWKWLKRTLTTRLYHNPNYRKSRPEEAARDLYLLKSIKSMDFNSLLPLIEAGNIPGFK